MIYGLCFQIFRDILCIWCTNVKCDGLIVVFFVKQPRVLTICCDCPFFVVDVILHLQNQGTKEIIYETYFYSFSVFSLCIGCACR